eukprot:TRINITY_DN57018_c0_g1_i1.p1 TRINITY_DN57018_c0_g1~~TRINITY_DN57018_c0_g1_i1.p1  ORF type:complete len:401 (-),score=21.88 TRINITY_DN57018_c0_g1_i1:144-1346(-)
MLTRLSHLRTQSCRVLAQSASSFICIRWRHTRPTDFAGNERLKKQLRASQGPLRAIRSDDALGFRAQISNASRGADVVSILENADGAGAPEFGKAFQRCGQLRDRYALGRVWHLARDKCVALDRACYSQLITASAYTIKHIDGYVPEGSDVGGALEYGKAAWNEMRAVGMTPNSPQYGAALGLCAKAGDGDWASQLWAELNENGIKPDILLYTQYLNAVAQKSALTGWKVVESELANMQQHGPKPDHVLLGGLVNIAGMQHQVERVDWVWSELAHLVEVNVLNYHARAKALILCGHPVRVLTLREEMSSIGIAPDVHTFLFEAQACLLALHSNCQQVDSVPSFDHLFAVINHAKAALDAKKEPRSKRAKVDKICELAGRLAQGEQLSLTSVRVMGWPWPQ